MAHYWEVAFAGSRESGRMPVLRFYINGKCALLASPAQRTAFLLAVHSLGSIFPTNHLYPPIKVADLGRKRGDWPSMVTWASRWSITAGVPPIKIVYAVPLATNGRRVRLVHHWIPQKHPKNTPTPTNPNTQTKTRLLCRRNCSSNPVPYG